ncbi:MAG: hypothetical protein A3E80_03575 [Chlamydiae bacterium RIFCSPHIGHO2_12_FULL_49_9]|nr:MAG: hypothetical protein A3E80_03575 [Chlamydiae bacterium RIFCSPHIGHO2_12_FULL_49_9]
MSAILAVSGRVVEKPERISTNRRVYEWIKDEWELGSPWKAVAAAVAGAVLLPLTLVGAVFGAIPAWEREVEKTPDLFRIRAADSSPIKGILSRKIKAFAQDPAQEDFIPEIQELLFDVYQECENPEDARKIEKALKETIGISAKKGLQKTAKGTIKLIKNVIFDQIMTDEFKKSISDARVEKLLGDFAVEIERADSFFAEIEKLKERATGFVHPDAIEQLALEAEKRHIARFYEDRIETLVKANQIQEIKPLLETLVEGPLKEGLMSYAAQLLLEPFKREIETIDPFGNWATMKRRYTQLRNCLKAAGITGDALTGTLDEARILMEEQFVNYIALSLAQGEDVGDWISDLIQMEVIKEDYAVHFISAVAERRDQFLAIDA